MSPGIQIWNLLNYRLKDYRWPKIGSVCTDHGCREMEVLVSVSMDITVKMNKNPTRCNSMQIFIYCKITLHTSGVTTPIIRSAKDCNRSLRYRSYYRYSFFPPTWPRWREVAVPIIWPVPEAVVTVFCAPDDGCGGQPKHVEWFCSK